MTRVLHTGDTHVGYRQYHLPERRADFLEAFEQVATDAVELGVDAVIHAGDLFHDRRPDLPDILGTLSVLRTLQEAEIPFLAIVGNHETKRDGQWLDLFEALGLTTRLGAEPVVVGDTAFYGLDFVPRSRRDDLDYAFEPHDAKHAALVGHGLFDPLVPDYGNVEWDAAEVLAESTVEFDAMLLGDEHKPTRKEVDGTWVTYCGSTERTSAGEREDRGYNLVEFDGEVHISRRGLETREFVFIDLELGESEGFDRVRERLREHDLDGAVVVVSIDGDGEDVSPARVESLAEEEGALVARVTDRREIVEEATIDVSFADPDEAVRERVRDLGLSSAAYDLDETIRASKIADSNVADEVERRVGELADDPEAFEPAGGLETETVVDRLGDSDIKASPETSGDDDDEDTNVGADETNGDDDTNVEDGGSANESEANASGETRKAIKSGENEGVSASTETDGSETETASKRQSEPRTESDSETAVRSGDDQASMEDYL